MAMDERVRSAARRRRKRTVTLIKDTALFVFCAAGLFFLLNDLFFRISGVPTSTDVVRFFGGGSKPYVELKSGEASVSFINVGQGDCELIRTDGYNILIDSGDAGCEGDVVGFLKYSGVDRLDIVIVSHPHSDHYGAMYEVLRKFDVGLFLMPELPEDKIPYGITYERLLTVIDNNKISARYAKADERFYLGEDCYLDILSPRFYDYDDLNDFSITAKFVHGENSFLFTGDLQKFSEIDLVESGADVDVDVLKVGHHGSAGASCEEFLDAVTPKIAVFEAAEYNMYRHPRAEVLERLTAVGCSTTYSTANNGNVVIVSDGESLRVEVERAQALVLDE
ncbi:MAG: MBL fold metallo-hydrolase [Oscillospiraceae bacterium]|nr:MBL fold metallo-hydrolase [Oscillospiraceae bacterium]